MNKTQNKIVNAQFEHPCIRPEIGELLPDYIVNLLADWAADEVEEHLLGCRQCRENYLKVISLPGAARAKKERAAAAAKESSPARGELVRFADFKK
jgi:Putative zinc-finger